MVDWVGLTVPFAYLGVLVGSLATFSSLYRKRKAAKSSALESWFPPHLQKNIYLSLLHLEQTEPGKDKSVTVPDSILKAALLRRATEDISRIISIRTGKQALATLLARGSVGDDLWQRFLRAEKEVEEELKDVVSEANALAPGWGQTIFQSANEITASQAVRIRYGELQAQAKVDREWWDKKRAGMQSDLMKEYHEKASAKGDSKVNSAAGSRRASTIASTVGGDEKKGSDEDAVLVEAGGPTAAGTGGGAAKKKKKGKK
ncbi:MAG: translocation protein S66 [Icmadophila ericetorum]|nr:translocation protein S66 [Icmadophila ericetorum]